MNIGRPGDIQGDGFRLRAINERDGQLIVAASQSDIPDWTFIPRDLNESEAEVWIQRGLSAKDTGRAIRFVIETPTGVAGTVGAEHPYAHDDGIVETFYFVLPAFRRKGLASAALRLLNAWVRDVTPALRRLQLHVIVGNQGSGHVAELASYRFEGVLVNQIPAANGYGPRNAEVYGIAVEGSDEIEVGGVLA